MRSGLRVLTAVTVVLSGVRAFSQEEQAPPAAAFTDITAESGIAQLVEERYAGIPKWWISGLHFVDLDADGDLDFYLSGHGGGGVATLNDGAGRFAAAPGEYPTSEVLLPYDVNEDGKVDLAMNYVDGGARWWLNESTPGKLHFVQTDQLAGGNCGRMNVIVDINRDGKADWLRSAGGNLVFDFGDGTGRFEPGRFTIEMTEGYRFEHAITPADVDGDGDIDLFTEWGRYAFGSGKCRFFRNDGDMKFVDATAEAGLYEEELSVKGIGDFDHDGDIDLIALENLKTFSVFLNDGKGRFTRKENAISGLEGPLPHLASWGLATVTDLDNDGAVDILINGKYFLKILRGTGSGNFTYANKAWGIDDFSAASVDDGLCFGDIDGDGDLDMAGYAAGRKRTEAKIYRNDLPAQNWLRVRPVGAPGNSGAGGAKIRLYEPGTKRLLWFEEVAIYGRQSVQSYYGHAVTERHFGLGSRGAVDIEVVFYPSAKTVRAEAVKANRTIDIREVTGGAKEQEKQ